MEEESAGEVKCLDHCNRNFPIQPVSQSWAAGNLVDVYRIDPNSDPDLATTKSFSAPKCGSGMNERIGQQILCHRIMLQGRIFTEAGAIPPESIVSYTNPMNVRLLLVLDKQCNGSVPDPFDVLVSALTGPLPALFSPTVADMTQRSFEVLDEMMLFLPPVQPLVIANQSVSSTGTLKGLSLVGDPISWSSTTAGTVALAAGTGGPIAVATTPDFPTVPFTIGQVPLIGEADFNFSTTEDTTTYLVIGRDAPFELAYEFPQPLLINLKSPGTGSANDVVDNNILLIAGCDPGNQCLMNVFGRMFFTG